LLSCFYLFSVVAGGVFEYGHYFSDSSHLPWAESLMAEVLCFYHSTWW
jgi:hypothetical protein